MRLVTGYRFARAFHQAGDLAAAYALSLKVVGISLDPNLTYAARLEREIERLISWNSFSTLPNAMK